MEGGADFFYVVAVNADDLVELLAGDMELVGPIGDVGGHLGVDLLGVMRAFDVRALMTVMLGIVDGLGGGENGVGGVGCDEGVSAVRVGHACFLFQCSFREMRMR